MKKHILLIIAAFVFFSCDNPSMRFFKDEVSKKKSKQASTITTSGYLVYTAMIVQTGNDIDVAPVATVFENTIGNIVWSYDGQGSCRGILTGAFPAGKSFLSITTNTFTAAASFLDENTIYYSNYDYTWSGLDNCSVFLEIRVYP